MARTDYGAILSTVIKDTSDAIREVNGTNALIAPNAWGVNIRTMKSADDYENVLDQLIQEEVASAPVASFSDGANNLPLPELSLSINPTQSGSGDPYPAGGGKNKLQVMPFETRTSNGITFTYNNDGTVTLNGTSTGRAYQYLRTYTDGWLKNDIAYTVSMRGLPDTALSTFLNLAYSDNGTAYSGSYGTLIGNREKTITPTHQYTSVLLDIPQGQTFNNNKIYVQIEEGSTATDFAPYDNIRPITGVSSVNVTRTGKNLLPMPITSGSYSNQVTITVNDDKSFYVSKPSGSGWTTIPLATMMLKKGTYTLIEDDDSSDNCAINVYLAGTTTPLKNTRYVKRVVFTVAEDTKVDINYSRSASADNVLTKLMLFVGNTATATDYEPYTGNTYLIQLGDTYYGGELYIDEDGNVKFRGTNGYAIINVNKTHTFGVNASGYGRAEFSMTSLGAPKGKSGSTADENVCDKLRSTNPAYSWNYGTKYSCAIYTEGTGVRITASDAENTSALMDAWLTTLGDIMLIYPLATPIEIDLTPTQINSLLGQNNLWHDGNGDTSCTYYANGQLYVEQHST